jgi:mannan endo-1,4-beta-mannosidase
MARYREQVQRVLNYRDNHGVRLADNGAILAWDILNEPRPNLGTPDGAVVTWTQQMSGYIGSLDQRHLITIGTEGFGPGYPADLNLAARPGSELSALCQIPSITLCSAHLFPNYLSNPNSSATIGQAVQNWRTTADKANKPLIIEEVGYSFSDAKTFTVRQEFFDNVSRAINNSDLDGGLLWNVGAQADRSFTFQYGDRDSERTLSAWSTLIRKTR